MVISQRTLLPLTRLRASFTSPPVTVNAWSRSVFSLKSSLGSSLNCNSKVNSDCPSWELGSSGLLAVSGVRAPAVPLTRISSKEFVW